MKKFHAKFTNLGATGRLGPRTLGSHYVGKDNEKMVTLRNGIQFWTVPSAGHTRSLQLALLGDTIDMVQLREVVGLT